jgi:hypothetical protein
VKVQISINNELLRQTDEAAKALRLTRGQIITRALQDFLHRRLHAEMLDRLNEVYGSRRDPADKNLLNSMKEKFRRALTRDG